MIPRKKRAATFILMCLGLLLLSVGSTPTAQAQTIQVTAADPTSTAQGTINLNVKITGKGFKNGAKAKFLVTGTTDAGGIQVNSTAFISSGELTANINVSDTATLANFDIQVSNTDGRTGKGTEMFTVTVKSTAPVTDTPVTTTIDGLGPNTLPTLRIQSDLLGAYQNSSSLQSILQASLGDWVLDMLNFNSSPQRKVLVDLRDPVPGSGPNGSNPNNPLGANGYQYVRARFIEQCSVYGIDMRTIAGGATVYCPLVIAFNDANGVRYRLTMRADNYTEVNLTRVTCLSTDASSKCNQWKIEPSATQLNGEVKNIAKLFKVATKPNQADQDMGDFYLSFTIHLTNP
jgi:hypothetical protein